MVWNMEGGGVAVVEVNRRVYIYIYGSHVYVTRRSSRYVLQGLGGYLSRGVEERRAFG